jgi:2,4-dienoyl-CoA reductase-like NADH-dependent reductase (Old Yellow Enzyme family)
MYSSEDGFSNDWHLVHLGSRAVGGAGLVLTEATAVSPEGRITPHDLGLWKEEHEEGLKRITRFIASQGAVPGIQLAHAGRKASHARPWDGGAFLKEDEGGWQTVAPSPIAFDPADDIPMELDQDGIDQVVVDFVHATKRAVRSGFKVVEIHAAHGYLLNEFLSPLTNHRTDRYGGSFENRVRLLVEIADGIREVLPEGYPLFVRISASDWVEGGWSADDSVALARLLQQHGVDLIDCSSGGTVPHVRIPLTQGYQVPFAERIKKETGMLTGAVGLITDPAQAEAIVEQGQADLVLLAREFLRDPYFPLHAAQALGSDVDWAEQYVRAK